MKKISIILISALLTAWSCYKSPDALPAKPCRVSEIVFTVAPIGTAATSTTYNYEYNSENMLVKEVWASSASSSTTTYTYTYKSGEISSITNGTNTSIWTHQNGVATSVNNKLFTYDGEGRLTNWSDLTFPSNYEVNATLTYDAVGNVLTKHFTMNLASPIDITTTYSGYDNKISPYTLLAEATNQPVFHFPDGGVEDKGIWKNNPGSESTTGTGTSSFTYAYQYNAKGYPTRITATSSVVVVTQEYKYINCN